MKLGEFCKHLRWHLFRSVFHNDFEHMFPRVIELNMLPCSRNSIQLFDVASFMEIEGTTLKVRIVNVSVGRDSVGSFSIRGALHSADGDIVISSSKEVVKCYAGRKPWTLLRFVLERKEESIDGFDKQYLVMLGFSLRPARDQLAVADVADNVSKDRSVSSDDKVTVVHC